jgi:hypothetical protein
MKFTLRAAILALTILTGCDDEPAERRAFVDFLQVHIVSRPGVHLMLMNPETAKSFGRYASQYQIILDFNSNLDSCGARTSREAEKRSRRSRRPCRTSERTEELA